MVEEKLYILRTQKRAYGRGEYQVKCIAKRVKCLDCGLEWLVDRSKKSPIYCRECSVKGERNPMFGKISPNRKEVKFDDKAYKRNYYNQKRQEVKKMMVKFLGNQCNLCLEKNLPLCVWHFHHKEKENKTIAVSQILTYGTKKLFEEVKKCILLCANCHLIIHRGDERAE